MVEAMEIQKGFKQTEVGTIPSDWDVKSLGQFGIVHGRVGWKGYTKKDIRNSGPYAIGAKHIDKSNRLDLSDPTYLSIEKYLESPEIMVFKEDILIVQRGSIGKVVLIDREIGEATINPSMVIFRLKKNSPVYVFYYLISSPGQNQIVFDTSSTGVPMITQKQVSNFKIPLPPTKTEQTAIATALNDADALITQLEKLIAKKRAIKQGAMQELLKPKEGWEVKKLGEIAAITKLAGFEYTNYFNSYNDGGEIIVVRGTNITHNKMDLTDVKFIPRSTSNKLKRSKLRKDDLVFAYVGTIGPIFLIDENDKYHLGPNTSKITHSKELSPMYLFHYFSSSILKKEIIEHTSIGAQPSLSMFKIRNFKINLPPKKEQILIAQILSDMDAEIEALEKKLDKYKMVKQGMMQNLLTGRIRLV